ncbi:MAG: NADH-quinone oxidoreductase subunit H [Actinomycetota bacterium]|nr:NADH-quinone oxidoreductase subunit H [Actinomycetota bacterium]
MLVILKKIFYVVIILVVNLYICEYIGNKMTARMELRRGYKITRVASLGFPVSRFIKFLSMDNRVNIWTFFIFLLSFLMWSAVPITGGLVMIEEDYSFLISFTFYIALIAVMLFNSSRSSHSGIFVDNCKKLLIQLSFIVPILLSGIGIVLLNKTLSLKEIVNSQYEYWNIVFQPVGGLIFFISIFFQLKILGMSRRSYVSDSADTGREGKGLGKVIDKISVYMIIFFLIAVLNIMYLGGWQSFYIIRGEIMLAFKFYFIFIILLLMDKMTGRVDSYKLMVRINWKFLIPVSIVNLIITLGFFIARDIYNLI